MVIAHLALRPGLALLDVGCGPGGDHDSIVCLGTRVVGIDQSAGMVREARARTADRGFVAQADAQALPFGDMMFDRVLAARVLATNAPRMLARLDGLHQAAAMELGCAPTVGDGSRFTLDDLELVRAVFPSAERRVLDNALVFHDPEPALRYYASGVVDRIRDRPADGSHRARLLPLVRRGIEAILEREGVFRDAKATGCFVAQLTAPK